MEKRIKQAERRTILVAALNHAWFLDWCRWHKINPYKVVYLSLPDKGRGRQDYDLVLLDSHQFSDFHEKDPDGFRLISDRAAHVYRQADTPIVENGEIVGWKSRSETASA